MLSTGGDRKKLWNKKNGKQEKMGGQKKMGGSKKRTVGKDKDIEKINNKLQRRKENTQQEKLNLGEKQTVGER